MKLNRIGVIFGAVYALVFILLLTATNYLSDYAVQTARLYLVRWPLAFFGLNYFGSDEFWEKYELWFFPVCLMFFYLAGCLIGRIIADLSGSAGGKRPDVC